MSLREDVARRLWFVSVGQAVDPEVAAKLPMEGWPMRAADEAIRFAEWARYEFYKDVQDYLPGPVTPADLSPLTLPPKGWKP